MARCLALGFDIRPPAVNPYFWYRLTLRVGHSKVILPLTLCVDSYSQGLSDSFSFSLLFEGPSPAPFTSNRSRAPSRLTSQPADNTTTDADYLRQATRPAPEH